MNQEQIQTLLDLIREWEVTVANAKTTATQGETILSGLYEALKAMGVDYTSTINVTAPSDIQMSPEAWASCKPIINYLELVPQATVNELSDKLSLNHPKGFTRQSVDNKIKKLIKLGKIEQISAEPNSGSTFAYKLKK